MAEPVAQATDPAARPSSAATPRSCGPTRGRDETCPDCGTVWEHDGVDIGAGAQIKADDPSGTKFGDYLDKRPAEDTCGNLAGVLVSLTGRL
jgi:hypothetical protein